MLSEQHWFFLCLSPHVQTRISRLWELLCLTALVYWNKKAAFIIRLIPYFYLTPRNISQNLNSWLWGTHSSKAWTLLIKIHNSDSENQIGLAKEIWCPGCVGLGALSPALAVVPAVAGERELPSARAEWVREQAQIREQTMCVLRQPPSEFREESRAPRKFPQFSRRTELHYKYSAKTVPNFPVQCRGALPLSGS